MILAFTRSFLQLADPRIMRILVRVIVLSLIVFAALAVGLALLLTWVDITEHAFLETVIDTLGVGAALIGAAFLFPVFVSTILPFFLEEVAGAVEARYYPQLGKPKGIGVVASTWATLRFLLVAVVVNALMLILLPVNPTLYLVAWIVGNSYLLGREYFELVALRRLSLEESRRLRRRHRLAAMLGGLGGVGLFLVPVVNLLAPVVLTMVMVHACQRWLKRSIV